MAILPDLTKPSHEQMQQARLAEYGAALVRRNRALEDQRRRARELDMLCKMYMRHGNLDWFNAWWGH